MQTTPFTAEICTRNSMIQHFLLSATADRRKGCKIGKNRFWKVSPVGESLASKRRGNLPPKCETSSVTNGLLNVKLLVTTKPMSRNTSIAQTSNDWVKNLGARSSLMSSVVAFTSPFRNDDDSIFLTVWNGR
jgi:hypothetical protein